MNKIKYWLQLHIIYENDRKEIVISDCEVKNKQIHSYYSNFIYNMKSKERKERKKRNSWIW